MTVDPLEFADVAADIIYAEEGDPIGPEMMCE